jgi:hypothetical protein
VGKGDGGIGDFYLAVLVKGNDNVSIETERDVLCSVVVQGRYM